MIKLFFLQGYRSVAFVFFLRARQALTCCCLITLFGCAQFEKPHKEQNLLFGATIGTAWDLMRGESFSSTYIGTAGGHLPKTGTYSFDSGVRRLGDEPSPVAPGSQESAPPENPSTPGGSLEKAQEYANATGNGVAVVEFDTMGNLDIQDAGKIIAEKLVVSLSEKCLFKMRERVLLKKVLAEQELSVSGFVAEGEGTPRLGELYGVGAIVTGTVSRWETRYSISVRMIDVTTGNILRTAEETTSRVEDLPLLTDRLALRLCLQK